ncbi:MAG: STAS/SEC14 domain-containing protein, partial [Ilumatobacter sp.]|nr:STAS/SEC14 domain-containing protein [Ilumatobacter sp.]
CAVIEHIDDLPDGCIGMRAIGEFTVDDFTTVIEPDVDAIVERHDKLRLVLLLGDRFTGFGEGAWGQLTGGIRHIHFHRGAVVTDDGTISHAVNLLKWTLHGHVRTFHNDEFDKAVGWIAD